MKPRAFKWQPSLFLSLFFLWTTAAAADWSAYQPASVVSYSEFKERLAAGDIVEVKFSGDRLEGRLDPLAPNTDLEAGSQVPLLRTWIPSVGDPSLLPLIEANNVEILSTARDDSGWSNWLTMILPWLVLVGVYFWVMSRLWKGSGGQMGGRNIDDFLSGSSRRTNSETPAVRFDDVAGHVNAKREVTEIVEFLKDPKRFGTLGAEMPRGVLLMGPPGTGKTLLARALAGEAGVPFFNISASEFVEVFVGVGASRVRRMFDEAKKRAPSIIFIDELDSVGRVRGSGMGGSNDEREQTLNQILSEMDGFSGHEAVVVIAATNRPDVLDAALLRPGRFDRHVTLELPDKDARLAILKVHTRKTPLADDVELDKIAAGTPGFSGADIKNLVNEAAIAAARDRRTKISMFHLDTMRDKVMMGTVRTLAIQPDERHRLAVHEAGHTAVAYYLPKADPLYKVTIIPRGRTLGSTHMLPEEERHTLPEDYLEDRLAVMLAGRIAEKEFLGTVSSGADDDIHQATKLARAMVARWGMSEEIGPVDLRQSEDDPFLGREIPQPRHFSDATAKAVDESVRTLLDDAANRAADVVHKYRKRVEALIGLLEERETLSKDSIDMCLAKAPRFQLEAQQNA